MEDHAAYPGYRWYVLIVMLFAVFAGCVMFFSVAPLVGEVTKTLGINLGTVSGLIMGVPMFIMALAAIAGGFVLDRLGTVRVYVGCTALMVIGGSLMLLPGVSHSLAGVVVSRVVLVLGTGPIIGSMTKVAADWFPSSQRPMVTGVTATSTSLGIAVAFNLAPGIFAATRSWETAFAWTTVFAVVSLALSVVWAFGPRPPEVSSTFDGETPVSGKGDLKLALRLAVTGIALLCVVCFNWAFSAFNDLTPGYLAVLRPVGVGLGPVVAGRMMSLMQLAFMVGSAGSGFIVQKVFRGKTKPVVFLAFLFSAVFALLVRFPFITGSSVLLPIILMLEGFFLAVTSPPVFAFIAMHYPEDVTGGIGGLGMGLGLVSGSVGVMVGSVALHSTGYYFVSIVLVTLMAVVGMIASLGLNPPKAFLATRGSTAKIDTPV